MPGASSTAAVNPSSDAARDGSSTLRCASPGRGGPKRRRRVDTHCLLAEGMKLGDGRLGPGADVEDVAAAAAGEEERPDDVVDVDEVARDGPVAEDRRRLARREALEEDRDHTALERRRLPRPVHVGEAQHDVAGAEDPVPAVDVDLGRPFRESIGRDRQEGESSRAGLSTSP